MILRARCTDSGAHEPEWHASSFKTWWHDGGGDQRRNRLQDVRNLISSGEGRRAAAPTSLGGIRAVGDILADGIAPVRLPGGSPVNGVGIQGLPTCWGGSGHPSKPPPDPHPSAHDHIHGLSRLCSFLLSLCVYISFFSLAVPLHVSTDSNNPTTEREGVLFPPLIQWLQGTTTHKIVPLPLGSATHAGRPR